MKIGIIGNGIVGQVLSRAFLDQENEVMMGRRIPQKFEVIKWKT